jgi:hypothetical protein
VYTRRLGSECRLIALNFSGHEQQLHLPAMRAARVLLSTYMDREEPVDLTPLHLRGNEGCIIELE